MNRVQLALTEAISKTMEDMAFEQIAPVIDDKKIEAFEVVNSAVSTGEEPKSEEVEINEELPEVQTAQQERIWSNCPLIRPLKGNIVILLENEQAQQISESLFGFIEEERSEEIINDAISEVLNTITGCFMKKLIPPDQKFEIGFPKTGRGEYPIPEQLAAEMYYEIGDYIMKAVVGGSEFLKMIS